MFKKISVLTFALVMYTAAAFADDAVFSSTETINPAPVAAPAKSTPELSGEVHAVENASSGSLSNEKFKSAVNNLESAQVDVREQLSAYKAKVDEKTIEVSNQKAELASLKKQYKALQKKMKNIDKMKKMLNDNIN